MQQVSNQRTAQRTPEARYAYYRRCQESCKGGEQCKAPAEKGAAVCYGHARQRAMAKRREAERQAVLTKAVAEMRKRGQPEFEMVNLFTSFHGIQVTIATAAQALVDGSIDCKTAGRLLWDLQRMATLLRICHKTEAQTTKDTHSTPLSQAQRRSGQATEHEVVADTMREEQKPILPQIGADERRLANVWAANRREKARICPEVLTFRRDGRWSKWPPGYAKAA